MRFSVEPVSQQQFRNMRHKLHCRKPEVKGMLAKCNKCGLLFTNREIISNALNIHLGKRKREFVFPEGVVKRLDQFVYEQQKDFGWHLMAEHDRSLRYFAANVLTNSHLETHANRCFKKSNECFAKLPEEPCEKTSILYNDVIDQWFDWKGMREERTMFSLRPRRNIEDAFTNTHNPILTSLLGCNNNILFCMTGPIVMYVTGYNAKSQQKEEREAFETVSKVITKIIEKEAVSTILLL